MAMWMKKCGDKAVVLFLTAMLSSFPLSTSYAECDLPREIAGLRLGDSTKTVLARCNGLTEIKLSEGPKVFFPNWPVRENFAVIESNDIPEMQLHAFRGPCQLVGGVDSRIELLFARDKLIEIRCTILRENVSIVSGIHKKIAEKCPNTDNEEVYYHEEGSEYCNKDTCWEFAVYVPPGYSERQAESRIYIDDNKPVEELAKAAQKLIELRRNKEKKEEEDKIKGFIK